MIESSYYVVQIALSLVILWYTFETRKMRLAAEDQLREIRESQKLSSRPLISAGVTLFQKGEDNSAIEFFENDTYLPPAFRNEYIKLINKDVKIFQISLKNSADNVAVDLQAVIYDGFTKNYIFGETGVVSCEKGSSEYIYTARDTYQSKEEICKSLSEKYNGTEKLHGHLSINDDYANDFCLFVFGQTITGEKILFKRGFVFDDGGITLKKVDRYVVNG
ncbi:hypothetical protein MACH09_34360 [Vibrio sp. MACH09]|uniref:hypothetical protein n=1 Tax=Vibrio sp. MACH09 TaxID=3025122 RepID=UPI00278F8B66|nr:hypothetical protein [Vibrio sp. MACH09]GLO62928.1 hypothetical protein MACH09_34360 [Vibrio sp. MACH09]